MSGMAKRKTDANGWGGPVTTPQTRERVCGRNVSMKGINNIASFADYIESIEKLLAGNKQTNPVNSD